MRVSGVNVAIMRVIEKLKQKKMRVMGIVRIGVARITGFYCSCNSNIFKTGYNCVNMTNK